jgi:hypothetical protein
MPAKMDWSRYNILAVYCDAVIVRVGSRPRRDYGLRPGHGFDDERHEPRAFSSRIKLPRVRVSRLYFLFSLHGTNGGLGSPYVYFTDIDIFDTLQGLIC